MAAGRSETLHAKILVFGSPLGIPVVATLHVDAALGVHHIFLRKLVDQRVNACTDVRVQPKMDIRSATALLHAIRMSGGKRAIAVFVKLIPRPTKSGH